MTAQFGGMAPPVVSRSFGLTHKPWSAPVQLNSGAVNVLPRFRGDEKDTDTVEKSAQSDASEESQEETVKVVKKGVMGEIRYFGSILWSALRGKFSRTEEGRQEMECRAIFIPMGVSDIDKLQTESLKKKIQELFIPVSKEVKLHAWYIPAKAGKPTVLFSHGNSGNLVSRESIIKAFSDRGYGVMAYDYRGFGKSTGKPTEIGVYKDMRAVSRYLEKDLGIPVKEQIAMGESLGGAVSIHVAQKYPFKALFVSSTFTNIPKVFAGIKKRFSWLRWMLPNENEIKQKFQSVDKVKRLKLPFFIAHGDEDGFIPLSMGKKLFDNATKVPDKEFHTVKGAQHSDLFILEPKAIMDKFEAFLARISPVKRKKAG